MKKLLLGCLLLCGNVFAYPMQSPPPPITNTLPLITAVILLDHDESTQKPKPKVERRKIIFLSYALQGNDLLVTFHDYNVGKSYIQKGCPTIINKMQKTFYVSYVSGVYAINCKNFK